MKIAFLFGSLNRGGLETLMLDVCQNLKKTDFQAVALYRKDGVLKSEFDKTAVPFTYIPTSRNIVGYLVKLRSFFRKQQINIVHAQQPIDAFYAFFATLGTKTKVILTLHGFDFKGGDNLLRFMLPNTSANIYVSEFQKNYYQHKYKLQEKKQHVIYNGIDFAKIIQQTSSNRMELYSELGIEKSTPLIGMVGNFNPVRDQIFICHFLKALKEIHVDFHFVFVGKRVASSPERYDDCVEFCKKNDLLKNISFLGVRDDVPEILKQLDAFVYATEHDTFGIAVVEAISAGIPVFVNDWEVMREITEDGKLALVYKTKDKDDLLQKFMLFLQDKEKYELQAQENAEIVRKKYSIEQHIENLNTFYKSDL